MRILVVGLGVIGATYGHLFQAAGHDVEHLLRSGSPKAGAQSLRVDILDGRFDPRGIAWSSAYAVKERAGADYDLIFISVPSGKIAAAAHDLDAAGITGTALVCCGIWEDRAFVEHAMNGRDFVLGYPVAGGNLRDGKLTCCVFDHFMLESAGKASVSNYREIAHLFADCGIELECPHDMLEWTWLHMAINAAVVAVAGRHGDVEDTSASAERLMCSASLLGEAVRAIRETSKIVESRGVDLRNYRDELAAYQLPVAVSAPVMKRMFSSNELTRKIMTLHGNTADLMFVCRSLYDAGKGAKVDAPVFYASCEAVFGVMADQVREGCYGTGSGFIRYWVDASAGEGAPWLVFLPGLTADHTLFAAQMRHFSGKANCLVWDAPAHGKSRPHPLDFSLDVLAEVLHGILACEGVLDPVLVGQSMGGYISQAYIDLFPREAAGFVAIDSSTLKRVYYPDWEVALLRHTKGMYLAIPWGLLKPWGAVGAAQTPQARANMRSFMNDFEKREFCDLAAHGFRILADALDAGRAYDLDCPALLLCGEKDHAGDVKAFNRKWAKGEGIPLVWVPDAGHNSNVDAPDFVNAQIERFIAGL